MNITNSMLLKSIDYYYTNEALKLLTGEYLLPLHGKVAGIPPNRIELNKLRKTALIQLLASFLTDKQKFDLLYEQFSPEVKQTMLLLVWSGELFTDEILEKYLKCQVVKSQEKKARYYEPEKALDSKFSIFPVKAHYAGHFAERSIIFLFHIDIVLRTALKKYIKKPADYTPIPEKKLPDDLLFFDGENEIMERFNLLYNFMSQDNIVYSQAGKILKRSFTKFYNFCRLKEFYPDQDKDTLTLRATLIIEFLKAEKCSTTLIDKPADFMKSLFEKFLIHQGLPRYSCENFLKPFLLNTFTQKDKEFALRKDFLTLLQMLIPGEWHSCEALLRQTQYKDLRFAVLGDIDSYVRVLSQHSVFHDYDKVYVDSTNYTLLVTTPILKGMLFLMGAFGLVELAYSPPQNKSIRHKDKAYLSVYDGLQYIRLTALGAYVTGVSTEYSDQVSRPAANLTLDDNKLYIYTDQDDEIKEMLLKKVADKATNRCYIVSFKSFLSECRSETDVEATIKFFHQHIAADPPPIWQQFLKEVANKINPFKIEKNYLVFRLKESQELFTLLSKDPILKQLVQKAEDYKILIEKTDLHKVKQRMEEFGYLLTLT